MKISRNHLILFLVIFLGIYMLGFFSGVKKVFPYHQVRSMHLKFQEKITSYGITSLQTCIVDEITRLPQQFSVIIGHAYGAHKYVTPDRFLAPKIHSFLLDSHQNIDTLIFTGDVFSIPSSRKWERLFSDFSSVKIFIAPGNHDIERPDSKEIFYKNNSFSKAFPFFVNTQSLDIIIDNSIEKRWALGKKLVEKINSSSSNTLIARHDTPIKELIPLSNGATLGEKLLPNVKDFLKNFKSDSNFTWVLGDGGASQHLPRIACYEFNNHRFIVNGIGEVSGDTILILNDGKIFKYLLDK